MEKPTKVLSVKQIRNETGKGFIWECNNGCHYSTREMADEIGTTPECLLPRYKKYGLNNEILFKPSVGYQKQNRKGSAPKTIDKKILTCDVGDNVKVGGKIVVVSEVVFCGKEDRYSRSGKLLKGGEKSEITVCRYDNGRILKRSPMFVGDKWVHA